MAGVQAKFTSTFSPKARNVLARDLMRMAAMELTLALVQGTVVPLTPVGVSSALRGSWTHDRPSLVGSRIVGVFGSPLTYAEVMERGRAPGARMPPSSALETWVRRKLGEDVSAYVVARAIGRKGIRGRYMLRTALESTRGARGVIWSNLARTMLERS